MKIKAIIQRKASETKPDSTIFEFTIGKFHLNSKLRFLTFDNQEPIKLSQLPDGSYDFVMLFQKLLKIYFK